MTVIDGNIGPSEQPSFPTTELKFRAQKYRVYLSLTVDGELEDGTPESDEYKGHTIYDGPDQKRAEALFNLMKITAGTEIEPLR